MALSARPWLAFAHHGRYQLAPLAYEAMEHMAPLQSEQCEEGIVALVGDTLRILSLERLTDPFHVSPWLRRFRLW